MIVNYNYFVKIFFKKLYRSICDKIGFFYRLIIIMIAGVAGGDNCQPLIKNCDDQRNVNSIANIGYKEKYCNCKYRGPQNTTRIKAFEKIYTKYNG